MNLTNPIYSDPIAAIVYLEALLKLSESFGRYLDTLPSPPYEWERIKLRELLIDYRKFNDKLTGILVELQKKREANILTAEILHDEYWAARDFSIKGSVILANRLAKLSDKDRIDLMTSAEYTYRDHLNPWSLDDMDSRSALFEFISDPSEAVIEAHEVHQRRCMVYC